MTTNHTELCLGLRLMGNPHAERAADLIESQAARIQKQALEYVSLQARESDPVCVKWYADQFDADQVRIAGLEKERDALKADAIERCAKVCDEWQRAYVLEHCCDLAQDNALKSVAAAIRALLPKEE